MTSRDFSMKQLFATPPPPLDVLRDPNFAKDGEARARALVLLEEPLQHGGSQKEQDDIVELLKNAATVDQTPLCRMASIRALGRFKDARAAEIVETVYLQKLTFSPDINKAIREQCLASLIETGGPVAEKRLILVAKEPPSTGSEQERFEILDRRFAAVRGLAKFKDPEAAAALVQVLRSDKDFAMRDRALESLQLCTGKNLPADSPQWAVYVPIVPATDINLAGTAPPQQPIVPASATSTVSSGPK
jgi:HEAT repeat protein